MRASLRDHLKLLWPELEIVAEAQDGIEALSMAQHLVPQVAFLDIQMPGLTGLQVAQLLNQDTLVIFVTAYDAYALEAFDANAIDYLLKPIDPARLARLVSRLRKQLTNKNPVALAQMQALIRQLGAQAEPEVPQAQSLDWLQVSVGNQIRMLHVEDVMYFESDHKYTRVVAEDCDGLIRKSLKELLAGLNPQQYLQIHRAAVVNRRFVRSVYRCYDTMELEIRGRPERLRVSESNQSLFRAM